MRIISILILFICSYHYLSAQQTPAPPQTKGVLITGGIAHLGNGQMIQNSVIAFENGKLTIVADATTVRLPEMNDFQKIDASGKHIYPGFIAPNTQLGLKEVDAVRATRDHYELGNLNPSMRSLIAYNTDSKITPTVRANGVLIAQIVPRGGRISGQSSIVLLDAWNWEDAAYQIDGGIHLFWPGYYNYSSWWAKSGKTAKNEKYDERIKEIETFFEEAKSYAQKPATDPTNLKLEACLGLFDQSKKLYIHTNNAKTITQSILFAKKYNLNIVIVGGRDSWMVSDFLKENEVPVILRQAHHLPANGDEDIDQPFKTAAALQDAGVPFCFSMGGSWEQRNLPFQAGQSVAFGLDYESAISGLTLNTAKILGIDQTTGTLEQGKDATLFIAEGDALDMRTCKVSQAFIQGKNIDLDNKQKALYRKYKTKYGQE